MRKKIIGLGLIILGLVSFLIPITRGLIVEFNSTKHLLNIQSKLNSLNQDDFKNRLTEVEKYNLKASGEGLIDPFLKPINSSEKQLEYLGENDPFAILNIPKIEVNLPIYLGATDLHLQMGAAQVEGTSLPINGIGNRSVIAGHRGWMGIPFFRNLDKMTPGDIIEVEVLGKKLKYKVVNLQIIAPNDNDKLLPDPEKDMLTLLTCHPYMINNERLLVNAVFESEEKTKEDFSVNNVSSNKHNLSTLTRLKNSNTLILSTAKNSSVEFIHVFNSMPRNRQLTAVATAFGWLIVLGLTCKWIVFFTSKR